MSRPGKQLASQGLKTWTCHKQRNQGAGEDVGQAKYNNIFLTGQPVVRGMSSLSILQEMIRVLYLSSRRGQTISWFRTSPGVSSEIWLFEVWNIQRQILQTSDVFFFFRDVFLLLYSYPLAWSMLKRNSPFVQLKISILHKNFLREVKVVIRVWRLVQTAHTYYAKDSHCQIRWHSHHSWLSLHCRKYWNFDNTN